MENHSYLAEEKIGKLMRKYAVPCIISLLVGALYNIVDQIFIATAAMLQGVQDEIKERSQEYLSKDDVADIVVNQFGLASKMNEKSISLFKKLMKGMMK